MRVEATRKMTEALNKQLRGTRYDQCMRFEWYTCDTYTYSRQVSYQFCDMERDYNWTTGKCRAIKVIYPAEFYAMPQYITTRDLEKLFHEGSTLYDPADTIESFARKVFEAYEV